MESEKGLKVSMQQASADAAAATATATVAAAASSERCLEDMCFCLVCALFCCSLPLLF
jgi:hypothetical protein